MASKTELDFSIFAKSHLCNHRKPSLQCPGIIRLVHALRYFAALKIKTDGNDYGRETFSDFIKEIYPNYLRDVEHLNAHEAHLEELHKSLFTEYGIKQCDVKSCIMTHRHCGVEAKMDGDTKKSAISRFYVSTFDSVHCYLHHLYALGLRSFESDDDVESEEDKDAEDLSLCVDRALFERKQKIDSVRKDLADCFGRFCAENNKFTIYGKGGNFDDEAQTESDRLLAALSENDALRLKQYLDDEKYDSDALQNDVERYGHAQNSNICKLVETVSFLVNKRRCMTT